jgi:quercetin dioxygenase-like cupin family protein
MPDLDLLSPDVTSFRGGVIRSADLAGYAPANHSGTINTRVIGPEIGAKHMEIVIGDIARGGNALAHAHPGLEQAVYVLEGTAIAGIDGEEHAIGPGDFMFFPEGIFHSLRVTSERVKLLVVYSPPYGENPEQVIRESALGTRD